MNIEAQGKIQEVIAYHECTKHHYHRFARSAGSLDWDTQPNPFRFFDKAKRIVLPLKPEIGNCPFSSLYDQANVEKKNVTKDTISIFFRQSLGISSWKSIPQSSWALRVNPSSGNLHPTEGYVIIYQSADIEPGIYHYSPYLHALEKRTSFSPSLSMQFMDHFSDQGFLVGLSSIYWRESWKYGERAYRYCHHDVGHAIAALRFSATLLGFNMILLGDLSTDQIECLLGIAQTRWPENEKENGDVLLFVSPSKKSKGSQSIPSRIIEEIRCLPMIGDPNILSVDHVPWEIIDEVSKNCRKPRTDDPPCDLGDRPFMISDPRPVAAQDMIFQRRSAVDFDGVTSITEDQLHRMLDRTLSRNSKAPFDIGIGPPNIHLLIFVHRVKGMNSGAYLLCRNARDLARLKMSMNKEFLWRPCCKHLPLYLLKKADLRNVAATLSCQQAIAGDSAFSLGMLANFEESVYRYPHLYPPCYWEAGMIGQVLYLEAEAHGVRATGIGCFFDDPVHEFCGMKDDAFQSIYHFTVGGPLSDSRMTTLPPYHHLEKNRHEEPPRK